MVGSGGMSLDITPLTPAGRQVVRSYGQGGFYIADQRHEGSVLVFPERTLLWPVSGPDDITNESLQPLIDAKESVDLVLIGCGERFVAPPKGLREFLKSAGMVLEWMDTGAACRTHGLMLMEERRVATALIAVE